MLPAAAIVAVGIGMLGIAALHPVAQARSPVGILAAGDTADTVRMVATANGRLLSAGGWIGVVFATSEDPNFVAKLYRAGAVLVFRADGAVGCADLKSPARTS
jgi:hypothetical protein